jgi:hypothetical protein
LGWLFYESGDYITIFFWVGYFMNPQKNVAKIPIFGAEKNPYGLVLKSPWISPLRTSEKRCVRFFASVSGFCTRPRFGKRKKGARLGKWEENMDL